jgi:Zn-finger in ubiquitin-hydrolases and other protein
MSLLSNIKFAVQKLRGTSGRPCAHVDRIRDVVPTSEGCERCLAMGDTWVHLRTCATCGLVGCCDSSKNKHAHRHADEAVHPIARSKEPREDWLWCYVDEALVEPEVP